MHTLGFDLIVAYEVLAYTRGYKLEEGGQVIETEHEKVVLLKLTGNWEYLAQTQVKLAREIRVFPLGRHPVETLGYEAVAMDALAVL